MIKKILNSGNYSNNINLALLILRLTVGFFMLTHGLGKLTSLLEDSPIQFPDPIGVGSTVSLILAVFAEVFCSILLILGLATRFATIPLIITMLVAAFVMHATDGFGKQELPLFYVSAYFVIALSGAGKYSIDQSIFNRK